MTYLTIEQVLERIAVDLSTLRRWEAEGLVEPELGEGGAILYSETQAERVRVAHDLLEMGVNEEGIEVILSLRDQLIGWQRATAGVLRQLHREIVEEPGEDVPRHVRITVMGSE